MEAKRSSAAGMESPREGEEEVLHPSHRYSSDRRHQTLADGQININKTNIKIKSAIVDDSRDVKVCKDNRDEVDDVLDALRERISRDMKKHDVSFDKIFDEFDANHDGHLSMKEVESGMEKIGITIDSKEAAKIVDKFSNDGGKTVKYKDFLKVVAPENAVKEYIDDVSGTIEVIRKELKASALSPSQIRAVFGAADTKGDNLISSKEFAIAMTTFDITLRPRDIEALYSKFDANKNDRLNYAEFLGLLGYAQLESEAAVASGALSSTSHHSYSNSSSSNRYFVESTQFLRDTYLGAVAVNQHRVWVPAVFGTDMSDRDAKETVTVPSHIAIPHSESAQAKTNHEREYGDSKEGKNSSSSSDQMNRK